jgi:hypothetical protein
MPSILFSNIENKVIYVSYEVVHSSRLMIT